MKCYDGIVSDVFLAEDVRCFDSGWWAGGGDADPSIIGDQDHQQGRTPAPSHMAHMDTSNMRASWGEAKYTLCKLGDWASSCVDEWDYVLVCVLVLESSLKFFWTPCDQKREREGGWYLPESDVSCLVRTDTFLVLSTKNFIHQPWLNENENAAKTRCQK